MSFGQAALTFWVPGATSCLSHSKRADLGVGPGGPGPPCVVLLNISALHVQYGFQAFAKLKCPECTWLHLRELHLKNFPGGAWTQNSLEKCTIHSPDIATVYYVSRPPLSQNSPSGPAQLWALKVTRPLRKIYLSWTTGWDFFRALQ